MNPRWATTGVFFVNGAVIGTWVAQIPWIQERFDLSEAAMGAVLVGMSLAVIVALPVAGQALVRRGSQRLTRAGGIACALAVNLPILAPSPLLVALGLTVLGATSATMDVSMNAHGVAVEQRGARPIMSSLHAGWSFGGMTGAAFAALLVASGSDPRAATAIASVLLLATLLGLLRAIGPGSDAAAGQAPRFTLPSRGVVLLAVLCFLVMITEGAMADWGGIYLRQDLGAGAAVAALAFAALTAGMTAGRLVGDAINHAVGARRLLRGGALLTGSAIALTLATGLPGVALAGLFAVGLGVANGVPLMFSAAGNQPGVPSGPSIAAVSSMGSLGFLAGPPVIGVLAETTTLPAALATLIAAALAVMLLAGRAVGQEAAPVARTP